jgi:hypothetical protein
LTPNDHQRVPGILDSFYVRRSRCDRAINPERGFCRHQVQVMINKRI